MMMSDKVASLTKQARILAAPFQQPKAVASSSSGDQHNNHSSENRKPRSPKSSSRANHVDFRCFTFKPLQPYHELSHAAYCGPTTESNWVIPGVLLVGAYPATQDDDETFDLLTSILKLGINKFVCLQQEYRPGVSEEMWRTGLALRPYFEDVKKLVEHRFSIPDFKGFSIVEPPNLSFVHCPIVDCDITDDTTVLNLCRQLVDDISKGDVIYLHCWGGHGRTGTVVSIMLHLMYGFTAPEAMKRCQVVHDLRKCPVDVGSPQTQTQRDQVSRIVVQLINSYKMDRKPVQSKKLMNDSFNPANSNCSESTKQPNQRGGKFRSCTTTSIEYHESSTVVTSTKLPKFSDPKHMAVQNLSFSNEPSHSEQPCNKQNSGVQKNNNVGKNNANHQNNQIKFSAPLASIVKERSAMVVQPILPKRQGDNSELVASPAEFHKHINSGNEVSHDHQPVIHHKTKSPDKKSVNRGSLFNSPHAHGQKPVDGVELHINGHGMELQASFIVNSDIGGVLGDVANENHIVRYHTHEESTEVMKGRPMSISLEPGEELSQDAVGSKEDGSSAATSTNTPTKKHPPPTGGNGHHDNSVRNALMVARQVLLGNGGSASANNAVIVGDTLPLDGRKKMVPIPPANAAPAGKHSGVATTRKVEKEFHSIM